MPLLAMILSYANSDLKGSIFDIQGLSVHDGPGCRTLVFLNGCTLNCFWCSNPEGINKKHSLLYFASKCITCGNCIEKCPSKAIKADNEKIYIARQLCVNCEKPDCVEECYTEALRVSGYEITVSKLYNIIQRDRQFWGSEGGVTLTGGEPLLQIDFATAFLSRCHQAYIHTAIETCGNIPYQNFQKAMPFLDWIFFDLKHFNVAEHKKGTLADNSVIIENAKRISAEFKGRLIFRLPLIPNYNDSKENIDSIVRFLKENNRNEINILPLHHLGREKYNVLNQEYTGINYPIPSPEQLKDIQKVFIESNINCYIGSETPF
ncbi:MAG: glycyl-radical enzyme activating protein [Bacteroidota bacterium]